VLEGGNRNECRYADVAFRLFESRRSEGFFDIDGPTMKRSAGANQPRHVAVDPAPYTKVSRRQPIELAELSIGPIDLRRSSR
jgi:hypothetical protein